MGKITGGQMTMRSPSSETIECPLCSGAGELSRAEILDRLGVKDFARVAQLTAEEAFRLLQKKHDHEHQSAWSRFETELAKRVAEIREQHKDELYLALSEKESLGRRVEDSLREMAELRERNQLLEGESAKVARVGKRKEMTFEEEVRTWAGIWISDKLPRNGDFIIAFRAPNGEPTEPKILIDCKNKLAIAESDIEKLVRDARERSIAIAALVAREESQLRGVDRESRSALMECGCFGPPASGLSATLIYSSLSLNACERRVIYWIETLCSPRNCAVPSLRSTA